VDDRARLEALRRLKYFLDDAFRVPGTNLRFGWDPIVGAVPWLGDLLTTLLSAAMLVQAYRMRIPRIVQLRMLLNTTIDTVMGLVPLVGDVADAFWKSNTRNFALLERHAAERRPAAAGDWLFVTAVVAVIGALALLPVLVVYGVYRLLT
jgi:hypothetical protein